MKTALLLVDIQNDFLPGGALAVPDGDSVVPVANELIACAEMVVATQDWHPADHRSFASQHPGRNIGDIVDLAGMPQVLWPDHCVQGTRGAEFAPGLHAEAIDHVIHKGVKHEIDSYSTFFDNGHHNATGLHEYLQSKGVTMLTIVGLATDYCVKYSALDASELGYDITVILRGVRGVELASGDCARAIEEMRGAGVRIQE